MKQSTLLQKIYRASFDHNWAEVARLRMKEFKKIFKRKAEGKPFSTKWAIFKD